jgi:hypothetical protein
MQRFYSWLSSGVWLTIFTLALHALVGHGICHAEGKGEGLTAEYREFLVETISEKIFRLYPFEDIGRTTGEGILAAYRSGGYDGITSPKAFAARLTEDMERLSNDHHLDLYFAPNLAMEIIARESTGVDLDGMNPSELEQARWENFGFRDLRILEGRVGYLDLRVFFSARYAGSTAAAAMDFLAGSNAVIIDLRRNGGGWDSMVTLLAGYFVDIEETEILSISQSTLDQSYFASVVPAWIPGRRFTDRPVYLLVSPNTASAAEAFASILKYLNKDVILVGETTAGAENPVERIALDEQFVLKIPCYRRVYFGNRSGWEGKGIRPDLEVASERALETAHLHALNALQERFTDDLSREKIQWGIDGYRAILEPVQVDRKTLKSYAGRYRNIRVYPDGDDLYLQFEDRPGQRLLAVSDDYFVIESRDDLRVRFVREGDRVVALERIYSDGYRSFAQRNGFE